MFFSSYDEDDHEYGFEELLDALINQRDFEAARSILEKFPESINDVDDDEKTVLHHAAECGDDEVVAFLLAYPNIDVSPVDEGGDELCYAQPLHYAAYNGHADVVKLLVEYEETELNTYDGIGLTPLQEAVVQGHTSVAELLLQANASPHYPSIKPSDDGIDVAGVYIAAGSTPLRMAVILQHVEMAALLLRFGADVNDTVSNDIDEYDDFSSDKYAGQSLLSIAVSKDDLEMVKLLCEHGEDELNFNSIDQNALTPFFHAVIDGHNNIAKFLLEHPEVEIDCYHEDFITPFYQAVSTNNLELVRKLLSVKKDNINLNVRDSHEMTPLHVACRDGFTEIAHLLIRTPGVDLNAEDIDNLKPLDYAIKHKHDDIVRHLSHKRGVDPNKKLQNSGIKRAHRELIEEYLSDIGEDNFGLFIADQLAESELAAGNYNYTHLVHPDEGLAPVHIAAKYANTRTLKEVTNFSRLNLDSLDDTEKTVFHHLELRRKKRKFEDTYTDTRSPADYSSDESASCDDETIYRKKLDILESAKKRRKYEEPYSSDGSSSDDSDDDFEPKPYLVPPVDGNILDTQKQWQKNPPKDKKILIAEYRGVTFKSTFFSKAKRRKKYEEINSPQPKTIHSAASYELAAGYEADNEQLMQRSKQVHTVMRAQEQRPPYKTKRQKNKKPTSVADQDFARYITDQAGYAEDLKQWHSGKVPKEKQKEFSQRFEDVTFTQNPYLSFGDEIKHPQKFGYGLNSDYPSSQILPRLRQTTGKTKRPCLGYLIIALFTPEELKQSGARHAPTLIADNRIGVGHFYKHARETAFLGYVPEKNVVAQIKLRIPSFEKYKPFFEKKYGLSEEQFNKFRDELIRTKEKSEERKKVYVNLINKLIEFSTKHIIDYSMGEAHKRNAVLMYQDLRGGYTNKLPELTNQKQMQQDIEAMAEKLSNISLVHLSANDDMQVEESATTVFRK